MDSEDPVAQLGVIYAEYARGNGAPLFAALAEDIVWTSHGGDILPWSGTRTGRAGVDDYFRHLASEIEVTGYEVERMLGQGDWVTVMADVRIRLRNGEERQVAKVDLVRMDAGRIAEFREYYDSAGLERCVAACR
jgi:ketosteroid isomerase-like protein